MARFFQALFYFCLLLTSSGAAQSLAPGIAKKINCAPYFKVNDGVVTDTGLKGKVLEIKNTVTSNVSVQLETGKTILIDDSRLFLTYRSNQLACLVKNKLYLCASHSVIVNKTKSVASVVSVNGCHDSLLLRSANYTVGADEPSISFSVARPSQTTTIPVFPAELNN